MTTFATALTDIFDRYVDPTSYTVEEEHDLIAKAKAGDNDAVVALMYAYAPALRGTAAQFRYAGGVWADGPRDPHNTEDLRSNAVTGLMEAIHAFDPEVHSRLAAVVKQHMTRTTHESLVSPVSFTVPPRTLTRFYSILREANGNPYEAAALAPAYSMSRETFFAVLSAVRDVDSYDAPAGDDNDGSAFANMEATALYGRVQTSEQIIEDAILVAAAFDAIDEQETDVVKLAYGFSDYDPVSDAEIAHRMGLSRPKVQRVRSGALGKMRSALGVA